MTNAVELEGVTKRFGHHVAVDHLDLAVPEGTVYGFIGPNGSGKTTTLRMILRILYPEEGRIQVLGEDGGATADDRVGYLPEERGLYKKMRVRDLLVYFARLKGFRACRPAVDDWLERFGLATWADRRIEALSKGMSQKVQFIAAVVARPRLLILDEPFTGLDPVNMELLKDAVLALHGAGTTVIFSTHDMDIAERMCDTIFMIYRGKKVLDDTLEAIQARYGQDTIRVRTGDSEGAFEGLPGVVHVNPFGRYTELRMKPDADPQAILKTLVARTRVEHFAVARPSLHDIFIRIAGAEAQTPEDTARA
jgi:ABC-2 type transport system ATP-binding protein